MSAHDRLHWDSVYRQRPESAYPDPNPLLFAYAPPLRIEGSACALDLASGLGQNGLWLAEQGYVVDLVDISRIALTRAQTEAARRQLRSVNFFQLDLEDAELEQDSYHLLCVFRYLNRALMPRLRAAVKPGGRVIYQTFNTRYLDIKPDMNPDYLLSVGELAGYFGDWKILRSSELEHISELVAIRPGG
jgi:tellurite methyltransferase